METVRKRRKVDGEADGQETRQNEIGGVDRISSLPDHLLHFIMFMLYTGDILRMSGLSKRLKIVAATFPVIDIDEANYIYRQDFLQGMQLCLSRDQVADLQRLRLRIIRPANEELYHLIGRFISTAFRGNLQGLHLQFSVDTFWRIYVLPEIIFSQGSNLLYLKVDGCDFGSYRIMNLPFLRTLSIKNVHIEEDLLQRLIHACPTLETLSLRNCYGLKGIKIFHEKLRKFVLWVNGELDGVQVHLPNLHTFKYQGYRKLFEGYITTSKFDILNKIQVQKLSHSFCLKYIKLEVQAFENITFKHLRRLVLHCIDVNYAVLWFNNMKFPSLQSLSLEHCMGLQNVKVISSKIEDLVVVDCQDMKFCKILAPNLRFFKYQGPVMNISRLLASNKFNVNLKFREYAFNHQHDLLRQCQISDFLKAFNNVNEMTMTLAYDCYECIEMLKELANKSPLNYISNLEVNLRRSDIRLTHFFYPSNKSVLFNLLHGSLSISRFYNTLSISLGSLQIKFEFLSISEQKISGTTNLKNTSPGFHLNNVEKVWIRGFRGCDEETQLVFYVVTRATYLKYISICITGETGLAAQIVYSNMKAWKERLAETFPALHIELNP